MAVSKYLQIDGQEYQVAVVEMQRKGDVLDLTANRTEDGVLHREVIGTFYNYTLGIIAPNNPELYGQLWWVLTAPVPSHSIQLPYQPEPFEGYFGSVKDNVKLVKPDGTFVGMGISCNIVASRPSRSVGN